MQAIAHAQAVTAAAFAKGQVPAPYYLYLLARANARQLAGTRAVAPGCASPATAGGTVYVQRHTAGHKCLRGAQHAPRVPAATRAQWVSRKVRQRVTVPGGRQVWREIWVTTRAQVAVL